MNEKVKQALEQIKGILNEELTFKEDVEELINPIEAALNDFDKYHESQQDLIKGKDEYIAKLCNDRAELKEQLKQVEDFKYHYDRYKKELANNLKVINCMQEEATTNYNLIDQLEDRNDRLVERLEKSKEEREALKIICDKEVGFSQLYYSKNVGDYNNTLYFRFKPSALESVALTQFEFDLVKKVVEKYGK